MGKELHKSRIGGQALIEGVMMKGVRTAAMACRLPDGTIDIETWEENNGKDAPWYKKAPLIRGSFNFISSLISGYKCLMKSAEKQMTEEDSEEELTAFEKWLTDKFGENLMSAMSAVAMVIGVVFSLFLFKFIPTILTKPLEQMTVLRTALEGIIKIILFVGYLWATSKMKDIRRTYEYHGAEHKTIACLEAHEELTVANVKKHTRFHPRCGTSFIFITLFTSIFVFCFIPPFTGYSKGMRILLRLVVQLVLLPLIIGIAYEFIRLAGRKNNLFTRILSAPGLQIQHLTTREPDDSQIEVAIAAIKPCIPENLEDDVW